MILLNLFAVLFLNQAAVAGISCDYVDTSQICQPLSSVQQTAVDLCEAEMKASDCDNWFKENPSAVLKGRRCEKLATCPQSTKLKDLVASCASGAWTVGLDIGAGIIKFLIGDETVSLDTENREKFFSECVTPQCKYQMLGPYADLFSKEEIEGHAPSSSNKNISLENQNYENGLSAKVLYRKLMEKIRKQVKNGKTDDKFIEPWSKKPAAVPKTVDELINSTLVSAGVQKTACYDPAVVAEMQCYALGAVVYPLSAAGAATKIAKLAGVARTDMLVNRVGEKTVSKKIELPEVYDEAAVANIELKRHGDLGNETEVLPQGYNESLKYRQLYVDHDTRLKFQKIARNKNIPDAELPKMYFDAYKEARLKNLDPKARKLVEEALENTYVAPPGNGVLGSYNGWDNSITMSSVKENIGSLSYYKTYVHEMEHSIQNTFSSKKKTFVRALVNHTFSPELEYRYHHNHELGAVKAEYDFLKNMPPDAVDRMTREMAKRGFGEDAAYLRIKWRQADSSFEKYRRVSAYPDMKTIKETYPDTVGNLKRIRNTGLAILASGDTITGGAWSKSTSDWVKSVCTQELKLSADTCDF